MSFFKDDFIAGVVVRLVCLPFYFLVVISGPWTGLLGLHNKWQPVNGWLFPLSSGS